MIGKNREYPKEIMILEAIVRRFPPDDFKKAEFEKKLYRKRAGYQGEKTLDYFLEQVDHSEMVILHDLRIPINNTHFQLAPSYLPLIFFSSSILKITQEHSFSFQNSIN